MSQTINIWGATYSNVPGVELPKQGGGTALFSDASITTATESDVASGKQFLKADGSIGTGTSSGGGGGAIVITDTTDVHGGTIREITAVDISDTTLTSANQMLNGVKAYKADGTAVTGNIANGSATAPATISGSSATVSTGTNTLTLSKTVSVTPSVTAGYISSGTAGNSNVSLTASVTTKAAATIYPSSSDQSISASTYLTGAQTIKGVAVSNTLTAENVKSGVVVTIGDSSDADRIMSVTGTYSGGSVQFDTKTATASNYPVSLQFTSMKGEPKAFVCRLNAQVSSSGSTTYYYIVDVSHFGTTTHGNCFRIGNTRRVDNITSGYSWSYSGTTLTITSSAASRSASPGAFYSGSYELLYCY